MKILQEEIENELTAQTGKTREERDAELLAYILEIGNQIKIVDKYKKN